MSDLVGADQRKRRKGLAVESLVASTCILSSDGELNVATSLVDDEGVDLVFFRRTGEPTLSVQVKATFTLKSKVFVKLTDTTFEPRDDFYILVLVVDSPTASIKQAWLIPSKDFAAIRKGTTALTFAVSVGGTTNQWARYRVSRNRLASRVLKHLDELTERSKQRAGSTCAS